MTNLNPNGCCETTSFCCDRLPDVLKATFTNDLGCAALDGVEVTLVSDGKEWKGETTCGSETITLRLYCTEELQPDQGCSFYELEYDVGCTVQGIAVADFDCTCDPVNIGFVISGQTGDCTCCDDSALVEMSVTITE